MSLMGLRRAVGGNVTVEFAILLPALFTILFGVIDGSLYFWSRSALRHGVTQAARCAAIGRAGCIQLTDIQDYAIRKSIGLPLQRSAFAVSTQTCGKQVTGTYAYRSGFGSFSPFNGTISVTDCY